MCTCAQTHTHRGGRGEREEKILVNRVIYFARPEKAQNLARFQGGLGVGVT